MKIKAPSHDVSLTPPERTGAARDGQCRCGLEEHLRSTALKRSVRLRTWRGDQREERAQEPQQHWRQCCGKTELECAVGQKIL